MTTPCRVCGRDSTPLRWACPLCVRDTWRRLDEIQDHVAIIAATLVPGRSGLDGLPRARGYESRPPLDLDRVVVLDDRSHVDGTGPDDDPNETTLPIRRSLHRIAVYVYDRRADDELVETPPALTVTALARYLRIHAEWCAWQTWGAEFVTTVRRLHAQTRTRAHDAPPRPLGPCSRPSCTGTVWPTDRGGRCDADRNHTYDGLDLPRLADRRPPCTSSATA